VCSLPKMCVVAYIVLNNNVLKIIIVMSYKIMFLKIIIVMYNKIMLIVI